MGIDISKNKRKNTKDTGYKKKQMSYYLLLMIVMVVSTLIAKNHHHSPETETFKPISLIDQSEAMSMYVTKDEKQYHNLNNIKSAKGLAEEKSKLSLSYKKTLTKRTVGKLWELVSKDKKYMPITARLNLSPEERFLEMLYVLKYQCSEHKELVDINHLSDKDLTLWYEQQLINAQLHYMYDYSRCFDFIAGDSRVEQVLYNTTQDPNTTKAFYTHTGNELSVKQVGNNSDISDVGPIKILERKPFTQKYKVVRCKVLKKDFIHAKHRIYFNSHTVTAQQMIHNTHKPEDFENKEEWETVEFLVFPSTFLNLEPKVQEMTLLATGIASPYADASRDDSYLDIFMYKLSEDYYELFPNSYPPIYNYSPVVGIYMYIESIGEEQYDDTGEVFAEYMAMHCQVNDPEYQKNLFLVYLYEELQTMFYTVNSDVNMDIVHKAQAYENKAIGFKSVLFN